MSEVEAEPPEEWLLPESKDEVVRDLRAAWAALVTAQAASVGIQDASSSTETWFDRLCSLYGETQRHYHTLNHIWSMFQLYDVFQTELHQPELVGFAIFFHDAIYDPKGSENELQSAELFQAFATESGLFSGGDGEEVQVVYDLIMATKAHATPVHKTENAFGSDDVHWLLDFDMAVLGWAQDAYRLYARQIRLEYRHFPVRTYCEKRPSALQTFLSIPNIFATRAFRTHREQTARHNLANEIIILKSVLAAHPPQQQQQQGKELKQNEEEHDERAVEASKTQETREQGRNLQPQNSDGGNDDDDDDPLEQALFASLS